MFRKKFATEKKRHKDPIRWRGHEVTRIEAFSDAVLAFAVTLLGVALEVPETYDELMRTMWNFIPFSICFVLLFAIWHNQNMFFRRYGLHDLQTIMLNGLLLFITLFFVFPLKFFLKAWLIPSSRFKLQSFRQVSHLFYIYSGGFAAIYIVFALMYHNAYKKKEFLQLTPEEVYETRTQIYANLSIASGGIASVLMAMMPPPVSVLAGAGFVIIGPVIGIVKSKREKQYARLFHSSMKADVAQAEIEDELKTVKDDEMN